MSTGNAQERTPSTLAQHRRAQLFVRALWGRALRTHSTPDIETAWEGPYLDARGLYLPEQWESVAQASSLYRAAAAHAVAHQVYGSEPIALPELDPRQRLIIGLLEDIRVETLACRQFPGLRRLWLSQHGLSQHGLSQHGLSQHGLSQHGLALHDNLSGQQPVFADLLRRLSRCLLDEIADDENAWIRKGIALFRDSKNDLTRPQDALEIALRLSHDLGQMRLTMNLHTPCCSAPYRDDNRHLWLDEQNTQNDEPTDVASARTMPENTAFLVEDGHGRRLDIALKRLPGESLCGMYVEHDAKEPVLEYRRSANETTTNTWRYPEWHYQRAILREDWCTLQEIVPEPVQVDRAKRILSEHQILLRRLRRIARSLHLSQRQRLSRQYEGAELDLNAAIANLLDYRAGIEPDYRVYQSVHPLPQQGLASLLLLDLSESANDPVSRNQTVLDIARSAALILAQIMDAMDEPLAVHGFNSSGRHDVRYYCLKDFSDSVNDQSRGRIAAAEAAYSTRLGTAVRHATTRLLGQPQQHRLLVLLTDGVPADIDSYDPDYLPADARQAVRSARLAGIQVFCLSLDPNADHYVARLFGQRNYRVLDQVERLPQVLPAMFLSLSQRYY